MHSKKHSLSAFATFILIQSLCGNYDEPSRASSFARFYGNENFHYNNFGSQAIYQSL